MKEHSRVTRATFSLQTAMFIHRFRQFITTPETTQFSSRTYFWLGLSLAFSVIYSLLVIQQAFDGEYVVQDDARKHIFWMARFLEPELFQNDLIANFFQSVEPLGFVAVYRFFSLLGFDPMVINKCLPLVLGVIMTRYCFGICFELFPVPIAAFMATLVFNQSIWMKDIFVAAIASSFSYPLFFSFLYYFLRKSQIPCLIALILEGLFYPSTVLVSAGLLFLQLIHWKNSKLSVTPDRQTIKLSSVGLIIAIFMLLSYLVTSSEYGPIISLAEARTLPEFYRNGRASFFNENPIEYWLLGIRSGMIPRGLFTPVTLVFGLFFPLIIQFKNKFSLVKQIKNINFFQQLLFVSISLFFLAHLLLFRLFLPNRFTSHSFYLLIAIATGITLTVLLDTLFKITEKQNNFQPNSLTNFLNLTRRFSSLGIAILILTLVVGYPGLLHKFTSPNYVEPRESALYDYLSQSPKNTLIASLSKEADNIPSFSQQSVLVAWEYAIPYQVGYYRQIRQRAIDLIRSQYSPNLEDIKTFLQTYPVDLILLDGNAFTPEYLTQNPWLKQWKLLAEEIRPNLLSGTSPALTSTFNTCSAYRTDTFIVLKADCIRLFQQD